jgi:16S rRNA (uracil1498-N3)-methyltransferase
MRTPRIYTDSDIRLGKVIRLDKSTANYLLRVLRLKPGADVILFNGQGGHYESVIDNIKGNVVDIAIGQHIPHEVESPLDITLAQGISRGERMDYTIQKCVELGVSNIVPLITERCGVKLDSERAAKRFHHWQGIIASACEQCGRNRIPAIYPVSTLQEWLSQADYNQESANSDQTHPYLKLVLDSHNNNTLSQYAKPDGPIILLIGPEGGLTNDELLEVNQAGFCGIKLGPRILRTETAGIAAICALQSIWGDLK